MGAIRDALEKALATAAAKRGGAAPDDDEVRLLTKITGSSTAPIIKYKPRAPGMPARAVERAPRNKTAKERRPPATQAIRIDGAAIDRRIGLALLKKSRPTRRVPLASTLAVYEGGSGDSVAGRSGNPGASPAVPSIVWVAADARVACPPIARRVTLLDHSIEEKGIALKHVVGTAVAERELVLGFDFGSSSTKLVISDRAAGKSFAVAVADGPGASRYLLPTAIRHCNGVYSLDGDGILYTGLKSDLLQSPDDALVRERAVAYLALAIRRARGWLFKTHETIYRDVPIVWTLSIGIPKQQGQIDRDTNLYKRLATTAWRVAGAPAPITTGNIVAAMQRNEGRQTEDDTVEVRVEPEIAAEIYGFVASESFDPRGDNNFLMVDVGGKTLDVSLFHVKRNKANRWDFSFFTSLVRPLGAIELHGARIEWWQELLRARTCDEHTVRLVADLDALKQASMFEETIPAKATDYVEGVKLTHGSDAGMPDDSYRSQVRVAVRRKAYESTFGVHLSDRQMNRVEYFLCGGGSRMAVYSKVIHGALARPGRSLFHANRRILRIPADLLAPGLPEPDYDRFAVAYGLSHLDRTSVMDVEPLPPPKRRVGLYTSRFVSKDMC